MAVIARLVLFLTVSSILHFAHGCDPDDVQCDDGRCIPAIYSNLCQIAGAGLSTITKTTRYLPATTLDVTTKTLINKAGSTDTIGTNPVTSGGTKKASTPLVTDTVTKTETQTVVSLPGSTGKIVTGPFISVTTGETKNPATYVPMVTDSTMGTSPVTSSTSPVNTCHTGYAMCNDGRCEPYPSLCGDTGYVTTKAPATESTSMGTTGSMSAGTTGSMLVTPGSMSTPESTTVTAVATTSRPIVTDSHGNEVCPSGWEQCKDGVCEPFHWLCTEHDGTVVTTPVPITTPTPLTSSTITTVANTVSGSNTSTPIPAAGATTGTPSSSGGSCPSGWELCADGVCEPFHWLCSEHDGTNITITTPVTVPVTPRPSGASPDSSTTPMSTASTTTEQATTTTTTVGSTVVVSTDSTGTCPVGWTQCPSGVCESFHWLCDDHVLVG